LRLADDRRAALRFAAFASTAAADSLEADSAFFPPRSRSAAARRRPPTPLVFGAPSPFFASVSACARGLYFAADELDLRHLGRIALAEAQAQQTGVAARPRFEPRSKRIEQLLHDLLILAGRA
jgi:hypothetical protein